VIIARRGILALVTPRDDCRHAGRLFAWPDLRISVRGSGVFGWVAGLALSGLLVSAIGAWVTSG
jgi:hypothetical protein